MAAFVKYDSIQVHVRCLVEDSVRRTRGLGQTTGSTVTPRSVVGAVSRLPNTLVQEVSFGAATDRLIIFTWHLLVSRLERRICIRLSLAFRSRTTANPWTALGVLGPRQLVLLAHLAFVLLVGESLLLRGVVVEVVVYQVRVLQLA